MPGPHRAERLGRLADVTGAVILDLILQIAGVAELADARDSKSRGIHFSCGFDPHLQHQLFPIYFQ